MKKTNLTLLSIALLGLAYSCGGVGQTEKAESVASEETAEQMMDPDIAGRNAARAFLNKEWTDTIQLQNALLEAKARQSEYLRRGEPDNAAKFDTAFMRTIRTVRPDLYRELFK